MNGINRINRMNGINSMNGMNGMNGMNRMNDNKNSKGWCGGALVALVICTPVWAQQYPTKPIRMVVPSAPGSGPDLIARVVAQKLTEAWGQSVVVDNKPGAGSIVGAELSAKAPPDGSTIFMGHIGTHGANPALYSKLPFDSVRDFTMISGCPG